MLTICHCNTFTLETMFLITFCGTKHFFSFSSNPVNLLSFWIDSWMQETVLDIAFDFHTIVVKILFLQITQVNAKYVTKLPKLLIQNYRKKKSYWEILKRPFKQKPSQHYVFSLLNIWLKYINVSFHHKANEIM